MAPAARALLCLSLGAAGAHAVMLSEGHRSNRTGVGGGENVYGEKQSFCVAEREQQPNGVNHLKCAFDTKNNLLRTICLPELPKGYCLAVGMANSPCEEVEGKPWCVTPQSLALYTAGGNMAPEIDCDATPVEAFLISSEKLTSWSDKQLTPQQLMFGLKAFHDQCSKKAAAKGPDSVKIFTEGFCPFADEVVGQGHFGCPGAQPSPQSADEESGSAKSPFAESQPAELALPSTLKNNLAAKLKGAAGPAKSQDAELSLPSTMNKNLAAKLKRADDKFDDKFGNGQESGPAQTPVAQTPVAGTPVVQARRFVARGLRRFGRRLFAR